MDLAYHVTAVAQRLAQVPVAGMVAALDGCLQGAARLTCLIEEVAGLLLCPGKRLLLQDGQSQFENSGPQRAVGMVRQRQHQTVEWLVTQGVEVAIEVPLHLRILLGGCSQAFGYDVHAGGEDHVPCHGGRTEVLLSLGAKAHHGQPESAARRIGRERLHQCPSMLPAVMSTTLAVM
nr:hypothetical protein [uncultured Azohydromonas sp.]